MSSTKIADSAVQAMIPAFETQWNRDLHSVWRQEIASFSFVPKGSNPPPSDWWLVFLDNSDQAGALAYHDLTNAGLPLSKIFVETIQAAGSSLSVAASHELCEMAIDPGLNSACQDGSGKFWACEVCDPVEDDAYGYAIGPTVVSDFVTPDWFAPGVTWGGRNFDFKGHATKAFEVLAGGYAQYFDPSNGWVQVTGAARKGAGAKSRGGLRAVTTKTLSTVAR